MAVTKAVEQGDDPGKEDELGDALRAAQHGDEAAFRLLYRDVQPRLIRFAGALVGADAEDVTSEAWLQIARDLPAFRGDLDGFRGWTATITRHRALDHLRRRSRRPAADLPVEALVTMAAETDTETDALDGIATGAALRLIAELPRDQAEAVLLRVLMGLDAKSAGKVLGKRAGAVRTASYRGLRRLADRLGAAPERSPGEPERSPAEAEPPPAPPPAGKGREVGEPVGSRYGCPSGAAGGGAEAIPASPRDKCGGTGAEGLR